MQKRGKRTRGIKEAHPFAGMSQVNPNAAGVDIGAEEIVVCDAESERMYALTRPDWKEGDLPPLPPKKRQSHSKNAPKNTEEIRKHLKRISGVDITVVDGIGVSLAQTILMEIGTDMSKFPDEKHFCSWLPQVAPKHEISGAKVLKNKTLNNQKPLLTVTIANESQT